MRYIRTKNKIYDTCSSEITLSKNKTTHELEFFYQSYAFSIPFKLEVLNQADTIEELVDEFVAKKDYGKPLVIKRFEIHSNLQFGFTIYGAIWIGADLHSVAKMNDKGELELL